VGVLQITEQGGDRLYSGSLSYLGPFAVLTVESTPLLNDGANRQ